MLAKKTLQMVGGIARNPATGDVTGYATLRSLLDNEFGLDPNLRDPVVGDIQKDVMRTLEEDPRHFSQHSQGLMFTARNVSFDPSTGKLTAEMLERTPSQRGGQFDDGQADGANSLNAARLLVERLHAEASGADSPARTAAEGKLRDVLDHAAFRVEFVVDLPSDRLPKVCAHRNSNRKQKNVSIVNHEDGFGPIKAALGRMAEDVAFFEGDVRADGSKKRIDVTELVRAVIAVADPQPSVAYSAIGSGPKRYQEAVRNDDRRYLSATRNLGALMTLLDSVDEAASKFVARGNDVQRFFWGVNRPARGYQVRFGRSSEPLEYSAPDCFVLPVFAAVARNLMRDDGSWVKDPLEYFKKHRGELMETVFGLYRKSKVGTTRFGKLPDVWDGLSELVS